MKKSTFVATIMGTIGGILFALGMCMALITEWGVFSQGIVLGVIGIVVLLAMVVVWRKMENKAPIKLSPKVIKSTCLGIFGSLLLGVGMCLTMVTTYFVLGIVVGIAGIIALISLIPFVKGLQ